jgi:hypothetical protein
MKAFNDLSDYSTEEIEELLELSGRLEKNRNQTRWQAAYCRSYS